VLTITPASTNPQIHERGMWNLFPHLLRVDQRAPVAGTNSSRIFKRGTR